MAAASREGRRQSARGSAGLSRHLPWALLVVHPALAALEEVKVGGSGILGGKDALGLLVREPGVPRGEVIAGGAVPTGAATRPIGAGPDPSGLSPGAQDQLAIPSASFARTWRPPAITERPSAASSDGASTGATGQTPRERVAALFEEGHSVSSVAQQLGVDVETAGRWWARWRVGGAAALLKYRRGREPAIPDHQLPRIEQAPPQGPAVHGFDGEVWGTPQVAEVIEWLTGVRLTTSPVKRLLRERLGWTAQAPQAPASLRGGSDHPLTS
jgi:transposase